MANLIAAPKIREKSLQFTLRRLLLVMLGCSFLCALVFQWGLTGFIVCSLALGVGLMCWGTYWGQWGLAAGGLLLMVSGCVASMAPGPLAKTPSRRSQCSNNLKQIGIALHNYHDVYGSFPPAYIADESGRPMHSWRVLLLPFLEQQNLYAQYRFDEPWDGPNNRLLARHMPEIYLCPSDEDAADGTTSYVAIVGPETMWPGEKALDMADIKDGMSNTVALVESHRSGIHWMEPRDLHTLQMPLVVNPKHGQGICSCHGSEGKEAVLLWADASTRPFTTETPPAEILTALTAAAGD